MRMEKHSISVTHVITDLDTGGAEIMLLKLLPFLRDDGIDSKVISLSGDGELTSKIEAHGVEVADLGMKRGAFNFTSWNRLRGLIKRQKPDLVQTWMYHADLLGGMAARLAGVRSLVWNIRNSTLDPRGAKTSTRLVVRLCALFSGILPKQIVVCSKTAGEVHVALGYPAGSMVLIPNGFDLTEFHPDENARREVRLELVIPDGSPLVGLVARVDPQKDHSTFLAAAGLLRAHLPQARFLLIGQGAEPSNSELKNWIQKNGLEDRVLLLGRRSDIPRLTAALDLAVSSSSYGEAFSNVLGEALACGVPCVSTDVGDAVEIIGETGLVVPAGDPPALARAMLDLLQISPQEKAKLSTASRQRIVERFNLPFVAARYISLYRSLAGN